MHPFFEPLKSKEIALLLTTLTLGGDAEVGIFDYLPSDSKRRLKDKAQAINIIPQDKRLKFIVRELKHSISMSGIRGAEKTDPSWIIQALRGESPRIIASVLINLPPAITRSVLKRLPETMRKHLPPKAEIEKIEEPILFGIRQLFERRFSQMPEFRGGAFSFHDVVQLERPEIFTLLRDLGLIELGQAFVTVGKGALVELCRRLPKERAQELIEAVKLASRVDLPDRKAAQYFLSRIVMNFENTEEFFQMAGLWRLAKGFLVEDEIFREAFKQRIPIGASQIFSDYLVKAKAIEELTPDVLKRLQDSVLIRIRLLSERNALGPRWQQVELQLHDPQAAQALLEVGASVQLQRAEV